jgi:hypothetical protein
MISPFQHRPPHEVDDAASHVDRFGLLLTVSGPAVVTMSLVDLEGTDQGLRRWLLGPDRYGTDRPFTETGCSDIQTDPEAAPHVLHCDEMREFDELGFVKPSGELAE